MSQQDKMHELWNENQRLLEENNTLKQSLEELIAVNTELTESIEEFSQNNDLQSRVQTLENENRSLKNQLHHQIKKVEHLQSQGSKKDNNEEITKVINNLVQSSNEAQAQYQEELERLAHELEQEKSHWESKVKDMEERYMKKIYGYEETISQLQSKNQQLNESIQLKMLKQSQKFQVEERKNMKVSATIEDLRHVLERQIEEKDRVIRVYEGLLLKMKEKLKEKF